MTGFLVLFGPAEAANAQSGQPDPSAAILSLDQRFWNAYNACDASVFERFFTADVEFYHDKGGATLGAEALVASLKEGLCSGAVRLRREAINDSVELSLLHDQDIVYGAVLSGRHRFYVREAKKPERLDGQARFVHLWLWGNGGWRMSKILSFAHGPAPPADAPVAISLTDGMLASFVGTYEAPRSGLMRIRRGDGVLILAPESGPGPTFTLHPASDSDFFVQDRPLRFEFAKDDEGRVTGLRVREGGAIVEEALRKDQ